MKLDYHILWFEDQPKNVKPSEENIRNAIARLGFQPHIDLRAVTVDVLDPLINLPPQHEVDLVLIDWKLGGEHDGAKLARQVRQKFRDTDIAFTLSAESQETLRRLIYEQKIDGVYCFHRQNLSERAIGLIHSQTRKVLDVNHMRGIVMAATNDLDQAMIQCLQLVQSIIRPLDSNKFAVEIGEQVSASLRKKATEIEALAAKGELEMLLRQPAFGAALRLTVLQTEIQKISDQLDGGVSVEMLGRYHKEVITPWEVLTYGLWTEGDGEMAFSSSGKSFDQDAMIALRLKLLSHSDNLKSLFSMLKELADAAGEPILAGKMAVLEQTVEQAEKARKVLPTDTARKISS